MRFKNHHSKGWTVPLSIHGFSHESALEIALQVAAEIASCTMALSV
jgi:hypothetical protein